MTNTFIMRGEWLQNIAGMPIEMQDKVIAEIVRYGTGQELVYTDDCVISSIVNMVKGSIDFSIGNYEQKVMNGQKGGRKKKIDDDQIYGLATKGMTAQEIADELGVSKSSVDKSEGWKRRKQTL